MPDHPVLVPGPVEDFTGPDRLAARVVDPGPPLRVHGYALEGDLSRHYGFAEVVLLLLTGELPRPVDARAFETVLVWWSGASVREAPVHAAVLARLCGSSLGGTLGVGGVGLGAEAETRTDVTEALAVWLREDVDFPAPLRARSEAERKSTQQLRDALASRDFSHPVFDEDPSPDAAARSVLYACGLVDAEQQATAWCLARLPALAAEAWAVKPKDLGSYPMRLPDYRYAPDPEMDDDGG